MQWNCFILVIFVLQPVCNSQDITEIPKEGTTSSADCSQTQNGQNCEKQLPENEETTENIPGTDRQVLDLQDNLVRSLIDYMHGNETSELEKSLQELGEKNGLRRLLPESIQNSMICILCNVVSNLVLSYNNHSGSKQLLITALKKLCVGAKIQSEAVCNGIIDLNVDIFIYIIQRKPNLTSTKICSIIAQPYGCTVSTKEPEWNINIPPHLQYQVSHMYRRKLDHQIRILQLTDVHYDELYTAGGNAVCHEPLCCGTNQGSPSSPQAMAGFWGDYRECDMPWYSIMDLLNHSSKHDIDMVYFTGDIINHRVWSTTVHNNKVTLKQMYDQLKSTFLNIPVFPILGNHEPSPLNEFSPDQITDYKLSTQWLYELIADKWSYWLPNSTRETILRGGYYTVLLRPGFRIIALNSNVAYIYNWWILYDETHTIEQLQWFIDTLYQAELDGELVHILTHIPTGDYSCYKKWSNAYDKIIRRFAHIIAGQFCGHTHASELHYYYNAEKTKLINVAYNGGSFTTYFNVNPNYRIYDVNPYTWQVEDFDEWIYNLTEANMNSAHIPPRWYKMYTFTEVFNLPSMSLENMEYLISRMTSDQHLLNTYFRIKYSDGDPFLKEGCDQKCHETNLCNIVTSEYDDLDVCNRFVEQYRQYIKHN